VVVSLVDGKKELCRLCRTSKLFRDISLPILYDRYFGHSKFAQDDIRVVLQHPRLEFLVNNLYIQLEASRYCSRWDKRRGYFHDKCTCVCNELDKSLGMVLSSLLNLKVLRIYCSLCPPGEHKRHGFFPTFKTRVLHKVHFNCHCSKMEEERVIENLGAECMTSVITLGWFGSRYTSASERYFRSVFSNENILPNVRHLHCKMENDPTRLLLQNRSITRLHSWMVNKSLLDSEDNRDEEYNPANSQDKIGLSFRGIEVGPFPLRNLRHIGTFCLDTPIRSVSQ
jgi:hypothetical protein